jgi:hypothetical protein
MPLNFPSGPTSGAIYSFNGKTWTWNGYAWDILVATVGTTGTVSTINGITADSFGNVTLELEDLSNVNIGSKQDDDILRWDADTSKWITLSSGVSAGNFIILSAGGTAGTGKLPAVDGSLLLDVNAYYLRNKSPDQITDGGSF